MRRREGGRERGRVKEGEREAKKHRRTEEVKDEGVRRTGQNEQSRKGKFQCIYFSQNTMSQGLLE